MWDTSTARAAGVAASPRAPTRRRIDTRDASSPRPSIWSTAETRPSALAVRASASPSGTSRCSSQREQRRCVDRVRPGGRGGEGRPLGHWVVAEQGGRPAAPRRLAIRVTSCLCEGDLDGCPYAFVGVVEQRLQRGRHPGRVNRRAHRARRHGHRGQSPLRVRVREESAQSRHERRVVGVRQQVEPENDPAQVITGDEAVHGGSRLVIESKRDRVPVASRERTPQIRPVVR